MHGTSGAEDAGTRHSRREIIRLAAMSGAAIAIPAALSACGGSSGGGSSATTAEKVSIRYIKGPFSDTDAALNQSLSKQFAAVSRRVSVKTQQYDWAQADTQMTTLFAGDSPPDVDYLTTTSYPQFADAGALADLSSLVQEPDFKSTYAAIPQTLWELARYDGKVWGVPYVGGGFPVLVNLDLLEAAGAGNWAGSYAAMRAAAHACTKGKVYGFAMATSYRDYSFQDWMPYIRDAGTDVLNADGTRSAINTPDAVAGWQTLRDIYVTDKSAPAPGSYDFDGLRALFKSGRLAILHEQTDFALALAQDDPGFRWAVALPPPGPHGRSMLEDFGLLTIAAKSSNQAAAWDFVKYLSSPEAVASYVPKVGLFPARTDVTAKAFAGNPTAKFIQNELMPKGRGEQINPKYTGCLQAASDQFEAMVTGKQSAAGALEQAAKNIDDLLA
jgi:ABC-type glycerol-3-phosphate transport system substrate-binding protein